MQLHHLEFLKIFLLEILSILCHTLLFGVYYDHWSLEAKVRSDCYHYPACFCLFTAERSGTILLLSVSFCISSAWVWSLCVAAWVFQSPVYHCLDSMPYLPLESTLVFDKASVFSHLLSAASLLLVSFAFIGAVWHLDDLNNGGPCRSGFSYLLARSALTSATSSSVSCSKDFISVTIRSDAWQSQTFCSSSCCV